MQGYKFITDIRGRKPIDDGAVVDSSAGCQHLLLLRDHLQAFVQPIRHFQPSVIMDRSLRQPLTIEQKPQIR